MRSAHQLRSSMLSGIVQLSYTSYVSLDLCCRVDVSTGIRQGLGAITAPAAQDNEKLHEMIAAAGLVRLSALLAVE